MDIRHKLPLSARTVTVTGSALPEIMGQPSFTFVRMEGKESLCGLFEYEGEIQAQLQSDHQISWLGLGFLTRVLRGGGRKNKRGEGFELRTDGQGVGRANGMLIATEARRNASAHQKDMGETIERLTQARGRQATLAELAQENQSQERAPAADTVASQLLTTTRQATQAVQGAQQGAQQVAGAVKAGPAALGLSAVQTLLGAMPAAGTPALAKATPHPRRRALHTPGFA